MPDKPKPSAQTLALLAELDQQFGKGAKAKEREAKAAKALREKTLYGRNSTGLLSDLFAEANASVTSWRQQPGWKPVSRLTYIIHEACQSCDGVVQYIGNQFTVFARKSASGNERRFVSELITHDDLGFELPHTTETAFHEVRECAQCIFDAKRAQRFIEDILSARNTQQELPFQPTKD